MENTGINCPVCGTFIEITAIQLLAGIPITCPECHLALNIDRLKGKTAIDALTQQNEELKNAERSEKFGTF